MNKVMTEAIIYGAVPVFVRQFASKGNYVFQAVSQLSMPQTFLFGVGVCVVAKIAIRIFSSPKKDANSSFAKEMFFTVLSGVGVSLVILGISSTTALTGASLAAVAFVVDRLFKAIFGGGNGSITPNDDDESVSDSDDEPISDSEKDKEDSEIPITSTHVEPVVFKIEKDLTLESIFSILKRYFFKKNNFCVDRGQYNIDLFVVRKLIQQGKDLFSKMENQISDEKTLNKEDLVKGDLQLNLLENYQIMRTCLSYLREIEKRMRKYNYIWCYEFALFQKEPENQELKTVNFDDFLELMFSQGVFTVDSENQFVFTNINDDNDPRFFDYKIKLGVISNDRNESDSFIDELSVRYCDLLSERLEKTNLMIKDSGNQTERDFKEYSKESKKVIESTIEILKDILNQDEE